MLDDPQDESPASWLNVDAAMREMAAYWESGGGHPWMSPPPFRLVDTEHDQETPPGVSNPYWEFVRQVPCTTIRGWRVEVGVYVPGLEMLREVAVKTYSWAIPSPGDLAWMVGLLGGRGVVEVGAGSGYWAWMLTQAGVDVVAYEPHAPEENAGFVTDAVYHPLRRGDASCAAEHPDRALFLSWPNYTSPWAFEALSAYRGDMVFYAGEWKGGCCGDDAFFQLLDEEWEGIEMSPHHLSWWGIHCNLSAYRRLGKETS